MAERVLLTIPISHYCEKVRWALDRARLPFREVRHLQMFHWLWAYRWGGTAFVPVLMEDGRALTDSTAILHAIDARLPPAQRLYPESQGLRDEVEGLEEKFDEGLGVETRRWMYFEALRRPGFDLRFMAAGVPALERATLPLMRLVARPVLRARFRVTEEQVERGRTVIDDALADVEARLADGRRFLCGDRFTAADLTFACMMAPLVLPREYGSPLPRPSDLPGDLPARLATYIECPAGRFALRMFAEERQGEHQRETGRESGSRPPVDPAA